MTGRAPAFWAANQPGFRWTVHEPGTPDFFREVEEHRYRLEPHIPEVVDFDRWAGARVLEVGCGIATDGVRFARAGARYTGLDATPSALELAERRFALEGLAGEFVCGSADELPFADASFELVYSHGVVHHIDDTPRAVHEFHRVLVERGTALVMVYHRRSLNYHVNIMVLRRLLAGLLLVPHAIPLLARLTGEPPELLAAHRELLRQHGLRYLADRRLFLSNNTDGPGNPLSKAYTRSEALELFAAFRDVRTTTRYLNLRVYPGGERLSATRVARRLERSVGWHLYVEAVK